MASEKLFRSLKFSCPCVIVAERTEYTVYRMKKLNLVKFSLTVILVSSAFGSQVVYSQNETLNEPVSIPAPVVPAQEISSLPESGKYIDEAENGVRKKEPGEKKAVRKTSREEKQNNKESIPRKKLKHLKRQSFLETGGVIINEDTESMDVSISSAGMLGLAQMAYYRQAQAISNAVHGKRKDELICDKREKYLDGLKKCPFVPDGVTITFTDFDEGVRIEGHGQDGISDIALWKVLDIYLPTHGTVNQIKKMQFGREIREAGRKCLGADIGDAYIKYTHGSATVIILYAKTQESLKEIRKAEAGWRKLKDKKQRTGKLKLKIR
jgi:hypothetical protein